MFILQIEHEVPSYDAWKETFDSDPIHRKESGVRRYRIYRPAKDSRYVIVDLEFDSMREAEAALAALHVLWGNVHDRIMVEPRARIVQLAESKEL
jgi:hypothetical protein